jgi:ligand-binding sensor domain-containing protein
MAEFIGQMIGPYRIIEQIGLGGMATVYKAYQASMDRYVAVKVLPRQFAEDPSFVGRFEQEARTIAKLEHPHILPVHDYGEQEGVTYLVMRFIGGGTLKDLITDRGPLSSDEMLRIMEQVGGALGYAHSQGVIHRDIKPSNVLIDSRGDCFLTDFGIARLVAGSTEFTATGRVVGTPAYMAPEQGMGEKADARSDIYALGIILYEMATGKVPFEAETPLAVLMKHASAPLPLPRQIRPDLPEGIERVILRALSKSPADRFQRVEDMLAALRQTVVPSQAEAAAVPPPAPRQVAGGEARPPRTEKMPAAPRRLLPWLPVAAGCAVIGIVLAVAAIFVLPRLFSRVGEKVSSPLTAEATPAPTEETAPAPTETPGEENTPEAPPAPSSGQPGWTIFATSDDVRTLAAQDNYLWAGGSGGLVRWDRSDGSHRLFAVADGLASNIINVLLVDPQGTLWVGTEAGLSRYDPGTNRWTTFTTSDGLDADTILSLYYDAEGTLWAGTMYGDRGLNIFDNKTGWKAPDIPPLTVDFPNLRTILRDDEGKGALWVGLGGDGVARFDGDRWQEFAVDQDNPESSVNTLYLASGGDLLAATWHGVWHFKSDTATWEAIPELDGFDASAILEDSGGAVWFAGPDGISRFDSKTTTWKTYESDADQFPAGDITALAQDADGVLWFGTDSGLSRLKDDQWETWALGGGMPGNDISALAEDGDGAIWIVDIARGIGRYDAAANTWKTFTEADGAPSWFDMLTVDRKGRLWIGDGTTLRFFDGQAWQSFENKALDGTRVRTVAQDESGAMWFGTDDGIIRLDSDGGNAKVFSTSDGLPEGKTSGLVATRDFAVANVDDKLMVYDGTTWRRQFPDQDAIYQMAVVPSGEVWVAGGNLLFTFDGTAWKTIEVPEVWIASLAVGLDGTIWGGGSDGLTHFDPKHQTWKYIKPGDGQLPTDVNDLLIAHDGALWVATSAGLGRYVSPKD